MKRILLALALVASVATSGWATVVDLTTSNSGTINGATFVFDKQQPSGTGVLDPFLRIQNNGTEQGYNTTRDNAGQLPFDEKFGSFTHDLLFSSLEASNGEFLFVLDIGEGGNVPESLLSLDGLKFFKTSTPGQNDDSVDGAGNASGIIGDLLYDMDGLEDSYVLLDGNRDGNPGNGVSDMLLRVPESVFAGVLDTEYIILWSRFGLQEGASSNAIAGSGSANTFEEWAHITGLDDGGGGPPQEVVPEPGTIMLLGTGLIGLALYGRRRVK